MTASTKKPAAEAPGFFVDVGSPERTRTSDLVINSHPLYRLSYRGSTRAAYINDLQRRGQ